MISNVLNNSGFFIRWNKTNFLSNKNITEIYSENPDLHLKNSLFFPQNINFKGIIIQGIKVNPLKSEDKVISRAFEILNNFKKFSPEEYAQFSDEEKEILNNAFLIYKKSRGIFSPKAVISKAEKMKKIFDKQYGKNKYTIIALGRSANPLTDVLSYEGYGSTVFLPGSNFKSYNIKNSFFKNSNLIKYIEYMHLHGIDAETISKNHDRTYIFIDYANTGKSLKNFQKFLQNKKLGLNLPNVEFKSLNDIFDNKYNAFFYNSRKIKPYSSGFRLFNLNFLISEISASWNTAKKLAHFGLIHEIDKQKKLGRFDTI